VSDELYKGLMVVTIILMTGVIAFALFSFLKYPHDEAVAGEGIRSTGFAEENQTSGIQ
jgi:hypothetical protein